VSLRGRCIEDVKIFLNQNTIILTEDKHNMRRVLTADLTGKLCNIDKIKAEMMGSNLEIVIPKIEIEETDMIPVEVKTATQCIETPRHDSNNVFKGDPVIYTNGRVCLH